MGWFSSFISNPVSTVLDTAEKIVDTAVENPVETALLATGTYYGVEALAAAEAGTALTATEAAGSAALSGIDLGGLGASPASWTGSSVSQAAASNWTWGQVAQSTTSALNLATSGVRLATLGKTMNASTATSDGLTGALAPTPIKTPTGLITTTPQGPVVAGPVAQADGFMGMDTQTLMIIAFAGAAIFYLAKSGNLKA
jgi:hypothetical protein